MSSAARQGPRLTACAAAWAGTADLQLASKEEQLDVLARVLSAGEEEAGVEVDRVTDDVAATKRALAQRRKGSLAALSGAHGLTYLEVLHSRSFHAWPRCRPRDDGSAASQAGVSLPLPMRGVDWTALIADGS
jgi:hypothetical protein